MIDLLKIIDRIKSLKNVKKDKQVAEIFGISEQNFNNKKKRETLIPHIVKWAINESVDLNWLITGEGKPHRHTTNNEIHEPTADYGSGQDVIEIHKGIVERFKNKELAVRINQTLLDIEQLSDRALKEIEIDIKGIAKGLRLAAERDGPEHRKGERRQGERRQLGTPDYEPERRSWQERRRDGSDRRKAAGED